ncbi:MAG: Integral rane protein TerC [Thermoleophilia bacterium]|nr:Integral rane protein TerC [Thermoleophilia bacterium]
MPFPELSAQFFVALSGIVVADLVLAGDNAVVIALAARNLPQEQRRRAILYGAGLAIVLRALLTTGAVFLLRGDLPFVQLVGGLALLYIGWQLAVEEQHDHDGIDSARTLRGAVRTILVADVVMSIDNVLAVAAFAKDDVWLVVFGLVISIPIVMGGASLLLRAIDRFPVIVWVGAALIIYVGVDLILKDPVLQDLIPTALHPTWVHRVIGAVVGVVVTSIAWYVRLHDDDSDPTAQVERGA